MHLFLWLLNNWGRHLYCPLQVLVYERAKHHIYGIMFLCISNVIIVFFTLCWCWLIIGEGIVLYNIKWLPRYNWNVVQSGVKHHRAIKQTFNGRGNRSTRRRPPTCHKSLTNFITYCCIWSQGSLHFCKCKIIQLE